MLYIVLSALLAIVVFYPTTVLVAFVVGPTLGPNLTLLASPLVGAVAATVVLRKTILRGRRSSND